MKLCYRGVTYGSKSVFFRQSSLNTLINAKYRGVKTTISPRIFLEYPSSMELKYRGVAYCKSFNTLLPQNNCSPELHHQQPVKPC